MALTAEQRDWLILALIPGVGTAGFIRLLARFKSPRQVLTASERQLEEVVGKKLAGRIVHYMDVVNIAEQEQALEAHGVRLITMEDPAYPWHLAEIYDPPLLLFVRGKLLEKDERSIAIVGTRKASPYGIRMAEQLAEGAARKGITVVSGMALGIDTAAHRGALNAGGRTIAVLGCGVEQAYPRQNRDLMDAIIQQGCVLSPFPLHSRIAPGNFPYRNRLISGLTLGTVVVEAPVRSGALITARQAAEQGREVFAVPGQVGMVNSGGPHLLIQEGAKLVQSIDDILAELPVPGKNTTVSEALSVETDLEATADFPAPASRDSSVTAIPEKRPAQRQPSVSSPSPTREGLSETEQKILASLSPNGSFVDDIAAACNLSISETLSTLTFLELRSLVRQFSGKRFAPQ